MITKCIQEFNLLPSSNNDLLNIAADWLEEQGYQFESLIIRTNSYNLEIESYTSGDGSGSGYGLGSGSGYGNGLGYSSGSGNGDGSGNGAGYVDDCDSYGFGTGE